MLEVAARAAFSAVLADPGDAGRQAEATRLWEQRLEELRATPVDDHRDSDLRRARLHMALLNALRGNASAAISQLEMLGAQHPDYPLTGYWQQLIRDGGLRNALLQTAGPAEEPQP
jgi:hypothetical protein